MSAADNVRPHDSGAFDTAAMVSLLLDRAATHLTADDLEWLSQARMRACMLASNAEAVADGIGCLTSNDGAGGAMSMGSFQSANDLPPLLFHLGGVFGEIRALLNVAGYVAAADRHRQQMQQQSTEATGASHGGAA